MILTLPGLLLRAILRTSERARILALALVSRLPRLRRDDGGDTRALPRATPGRPRRAGRANEQAPRERREA